MTIGATTFGVRRFVAAFRALLAGQPGRTASERFGLVPAHAFAPRRQVAIQERRQVPSLQSGFTLIELILVLALLALVLAVSAPSLSKFFKGRSLESEARRFMALTRHAQSRAVSEGVPMVLWFDSKQRLYGLNADRSFVQDDPMAEEFQVDEAVQIEFELSSEAVAASQASLFKSDKLDTSGFYFLRFNPDGFVSPSSPESVVFRQGDQGELRVAQSRNRLNYELQPGKPSLARR